MPSPNEPGARLVLFFALAALLALAAPVLARAEEPARAPVLLPVQDPKAGRWGFIDRTGAVVIRPQFAAVKPFHEGLAAVCRELTGETVDEEGSERTVYMPSKWEYIDTGGRTVIKGPFFTAGPFAEGLAAVRADARSATGYLDRAGKLVIPARFEFAGSFHDGRAVVHWEGRARAGAIDPTGRIVVPAADHELRDFAGGLAAFSDGKRWGFLDRDGKVAIPARYEDVEAFSEGLAYVVLKRTPGKTEDRVDGGYVDRTGKLVISGLTLSGGPFRDGLARLYGWNSGFWIDRTGKKVIDAKGWVGDFSEGLASLAVGEKRGYVDRTGKLVIPARYDYADAFEDGAAIVADVGPDKSVVGFRYIDRTGRVIAPLSARESPPR